LLRTDRPGDRDFGVLNLGIDSLVVGKMDYVDLRKIGPQPLGEPGRSIPQIERMVNEDEELMDREIW
jgi:hypothetical protein